MTLLSRFRSILTANTPVVVPSPLKAVAAMGTDNIARRRAAIEERINILNNSFGHGSWRDGITRDRIAKLEAELAALPHRGDAP